ncbi:MAG: hypothetical protein ABSA78_00720 [Candidatus Sulfotelmatobacter sp.]|jgi:hypothetical protein
MHIHANQINPNTQLDALYAAEKAAAKREAERTRKKLSELASKLAGEADSGEDCVVRLGSREESEERARQESQENRAGRKKQEVRPNSEAANDSISDWA